MLGLLAVCGFVPRKPSAGIIHVLYIKDRLIYLRNICSVLLGFCFNAISNVHCCILLQWQHLTGFFLHKNLL